MMKEVVVDEIYCKMKWNMFGDHIEEWLGRLIHLCRAAVTIPSTIDEWKSIQYLLILQN